MRIRVQWGTSFGESASLNRCKRSLQVPIDYDGLQHAIPRWVRSHQKNKKEVPQTQHQQGRIAKDNCCYRAC